MQSKNITIGLYLSTLGGTRQGDGCICHCPAHDDKNPSLSITSKDGKILVKCHAGCSQEAVIAALKAKGLWPSTNTEIIPKSKTIIKRQEWIYNDTDLNPALKITRMDLSDGSKTYPQSHLKNGQWVSGGFKGEVQPYLYHEWAKTTESIIIVEGEKCADVLKSKGFVATTSPGGAGKWPDHFGQFFKDKTLIILPDNDEPGFKHSLLVYDWVISYANSVKIIQLPGLDKRDDVVDYFQKNGSVDEFKNLIAVSPHNPPILDEKSNDEAVSIEEKTNQWPIPLPIAEDSKSLPNLTVEYFQELLPNILFDWFSDIASRLNVQLDAVSSMGLSILGGAISKRVAIRPKDYDSWTIFPCSLWCLVSALPGSKKSPILSELLKPLRHLDELAENDFQEKKKISNSKLVIIKIKKKEFERQIKESVEANNLQVIEDLQKKLVDLAQEEALTQVHKKRYYTSSATTAKLLELFAENPEGFLIDKDELKGLFDSFKSQGNEATRTLYLESWTGNGQITQDTIYAGTRQATSVAATLIGSIQPGPLARFINDTDDGFIERFSCAISMQRLPYKDDLDTVANLQAYEAVKKLFVEISKIKLTDNRSCRFSLGAKNVFKAWREQIDKEINASKTSARLKGHLSKYDTLFCGLCVVLTVADTFSNFQSLPLVSEVTELTAQRVTKWINEILYPHAVYIYEHSCIKNTTVALAKQILNGKVKDGDAIRAITRNQWSGLTDKDLVLAACEELAKNHWVKIEEKKNESGGRSSQIIAVNPRIKELPND